MSDDHGVGVDREDWIDGFVAGWPGKRREPEQSAREVWDRTDRDGDRDSFVEGYVAAHDYSYSGTVNDPIDKKKISQKAWKESEHASTSLGDFS